jgi:hypothetical protein
MATAAPALARRLEMAAPIPLDPPVTKATFPAKLPSVTLLESIVRLSLLEYLMWLRLKNMDARLENKYLRGSGEDNNKPVCPFSNSSRN